MEENIYIIETIDFNSSVDDDDPLKECVLNETAGTVLTDLNNAAKYVTCYENGEISINKIDGSVANVKTPKNEIRTISRRDKTTKLNTYSRVLSKVQPKQKLNIRKKLCYEKPHIIQPLPVKFKPNAPVSLKHPRKQFIDQKIMISPREFKRQLIYTADTITTTKLAPCTRQQLVHVLNGITTLFAHPAHKMPNSNLMQMYVSRCTCKKEANMISTDDMNLSPVIDTITKPSCNIKITAPRKIYYKRKGIASISKFPKVQITENVQKNTQHESDINLSSIKKIYCNKKFTRDPLDLEIIDHKYSKKTSTNIEENATCDSMYTITLDIDSIKEEHILENKIVILSVDNDGELTENNINVLLDAANIKTDLSKESDREVVALTKNVDSEDFNDKLSNIFVVRTSDENNDNEHILGVENNSS